jgi:hypothetical protein
MCTAEGTDQTSVAIGVMTNMIGALTMARLVDDPVLSESILDVMRHRLILSIKGAAQWKNESAEQHALT